MTTIIKATQEGTCAICAKPIVKDQRIAKDNKTGKWVHADCLWPNKAHASSKSEMTSIPKGGPSQPSSSASQSLKESGTKGPQAGWLSPNEPSPESIVERRLAQARRIVARAFNMKEDELSVENALVVECMRELYGSIWLERDMS